MKQLDDLDWGELITPVELCVLPFNRVEIESRFGIRFFKYLETGLGEFCISEVEISGIQFILASPADSTGLGEDKHDAIIVFISCRSSLPDKSLPDKSLPDKSILAILTEFKLSKSELLSYRDNSLAAEWILVRLDDNNNEIVMFSYIEKHCADRAQSIYQAKGHKQTYFVKQKENAFSS